MGNPVNGFEAGTPAWRIFFPSLVLGWEMIQPTLSRWGLKAPEVLDGGSIGQAVALLRGPAIADRYEDALTRVSLRDITEAEPVMHLATSWVALATWAARYERRRRAGEPIELAWLLARKALNEFQECASAYGPTTEA